MRRLFLLLAIALFNFGVFGQAVTQGSLFAVNKKGAELGACPLKNTSVHVDISGFIARVNVRQEFENSYTEAIEAVYTFPLSHNGAVDQMTMTIGDRVVRGKVLKREEARAAYEAAKSEGRAASLLDQERPNIFTQAVANIMPGEKVLIDISYVETLAYEDGSYEFVFPMTVAPRYIPGSVQDAAKIAPPVAESRAGHDISIDVNLNAGVPVEEIRSTSHAVDQVNISPSNSKVALRGEKVIPNKDFILRYDVSGKRIEDAVLTHRGERGGFFTLVLQPPDKFSNEDRTPKEIVFVLDTSGSMSGFPIEKAKEAMRLSLDGLYPEDTFNLITFAGDTAVLFDKPVPATQANLDAAQAFLAERHGNGGTEMMKAIKASLDPSDEQDHLRIVCFMTDGEVGNDDEIIAEVKRHPNARVFSFGIGNSINRSLLDKIAQEGRGEATFVGLQDDGSLAAKKFYERVRTPLLTDLSIDWNGMPVSDVYPARLSDLFTAKPVIVNGRFEKAATGTIKLRGKVAGLPYEREIAVNLPAAEAANDVLATLWARKRIDELSSDALNAKATPKINAEITKLGLDFGLMTQFTSFVAVEDKIVNQNGKNVTIQVPVEMPDGQDRKATLGSASETVDVTSSGGGGGGGKTQTAIVGRSIASLPMNSRNGANLMVLSPGTTSVKNSKKPAKTSGQGSGRGTGVGYGSGSGTVVGYGRGSGSGNGSGDGDGVGSNPTVQKPPMTPEMLRDQRLKEKLHSWLYSLVTRLRLSSNDLTPNEAKFVRDGKANIQIVLTAKSPESVEKLKALGFEVESTKDGVTIFGRIAIEKLASLAELDSVKLVLPRI